VLTEPQRSQNSTAKSLDLSNRLNIDLPPVVSTSFNISKFVDLSSEPPEQQVRPDHDDASTSRVFGHG
jgi:hypothetical protein